MNPRTFLPDADDLPLLTDLYQLTMAAAYWSARIHERRAVFELFVRRLPRDRSFLLAAGLEQLVEHVSRLRFTGWHIDALRRWPAFSGVDPAFFEHLREFRFGGDLDALPEGTVCFAEEPLVRVSAGLLEAQLLETIAIVSLNLQTLVATKAARVVLAARGRPVVDFGARRAHGPQAAVLAARAALIGGCRSTSNVLAAEALGVEPVGTMAHSWIMASESERAAFENYAACFPEHTTALVDTWDVGEALRAAVTLGPRLGAIRLDSGDLAAQARQARAFLDEHGCRHTRIFASGDLNEFAIDELLTAGAPIDAFGVGTELVTSRDEPALSLVYKLVAVEDASGRLRPVAKRSADKQTRGGAKQVYRRFDGGYFAGDLLGLDDEPDLGAPLLEPVIRAGRVVAPARSVGQIAARAAEQLAAMPDRLRALRGTAAYAVTLSPALGALQRETGG